jgi:hypothetical protein
MYFFLFLIQASLIQALVAPTPAPSPLTSTISDPGEILIINGDPCENCLPTVDGSNAYTNSIVDDTGTTRVTIMYQAAQIITTSPIKSGVATSTDSQQGSIVITSAGSVSSSIEISSKKSLASGSTKMLSASSAHSNLSTGLSTITTAHNTLDSPVSESSTSTSSKSDAESIKLHPYLYNVLAIYTITFTIFLIPVPTMNFIELLLISSTAFIGWLLLYLDNAIKFIRHPRESTVTALKSFQFGLIMYGTECWYHFQVIRHFSSLTSSTSTKPSLSILHLPSQGRLTIPTGTSNPLSSHPFRLGAWWKDDILTNLRKHSLHDYFNPADFTLEKYPGDTCQPQETKPIEADIAKPWSNRLLEDDIFSSDDELDTSPLTTKGHFSTNRHPLIYRRDSVAPLVPRVESNEDTRNLSGASKNTCVEDGLSPREKVSGFISWDALKREDSANSTSVEATKALARIVEKTETESSGNSWEREAMGAAI